MLSNHDVARHRTRYGGSEAAARAAVVLLLTLRGTPFLYEGEELGPRGRGRAAGARRRPGRTATAAALRSRGPATAPHGWGPAEPWLPFPPDPDTRSVEAERDDPTSTLHLYRRLLALRHASPTLRLGSVELLADLPDGVIGWDRVDGDDRRRVLLSFAEATLSSEQSGGWQVELASDGAGEGEPFGGKLDADKAVVLSSMNAPV